MYIYHNNYLYLSICSLTDWHIVEVDVWGAGDIEAGKAFHVHTTRKNPSKVGHVTGSATLTSFLASMLRKTLLSTD